MRLRERGRVLILKIVAALSGTWDKNETFFSRRRAQDASRVEANRMRRCVYSRYLSELSISSVLRSQIQEAFRRLTNVNGATRERQKEDEG